MKESGAGPRASGNGPRCQAPGQGRRRRRKVHCPRERRRGPVTSGLREDSKPVELPGRRDRGARKEDKVVAGAAGRVGGSC